VVRAILGRFHDPLLIIRSSAACEDGLASSNAGRFKTVKDVPRHEPAAIRRAIEEVIASYEDGDDASNEVLVQPMLQRIRMAGVAFTADIDTLAPYYVVNYDESGSGDAITSGRAVRSGTYFHFKHAPSLPAHEPMRRIVEACAELEEVLENPRLDVEFAFDQGWDLYILQARPLATAASGGRQAVDLTRPLEKAHKRIVGMSRPSYDLLGNRMILGVMPDWNPAEIIGVKPKPLALSLYKELVTDNIWAYQRDNYGYRNVRSHPLMFSVLGVPYIDVRADFNSFIPKALNDKIAAKLVDYYLEKLARTPDLHDKVEFEIVHSCYYLNLRDKLALLKDYGFNENETRRIEYALLDLTNGIVDADHGLYKKDLRRIDDLADRYGRLESASMSTLDKVYWLTEDCKRYGTLPFAGIARAAFVAVQFLRSMVEVGIIGPGDYDSLMGSLSTVTRRLGGDLGRLLRGEMAREDFLGVYGHLRPGTYDITSRRYDEAFDLYFSAGASGFLGENGRAGATWGFSPDQMRTISECLVENGLRMDAGSLVRFIKESIEGREHAKFAFTKAVSQILLLIERLGERYGIGREDLAFLDIKTLLGLYGAVSERELKDVLRRDIETNRESYLTTEAVRLPSVILKPDDIFGFFVSGESPNFVTLKKVAADTVLCDSENGVCLENKIVFIKAADPGYDFLFTKGIAGLVTQYGGVNSHMAIRCAELSIPAVIGAGETHFGEWSRAHMLEIDCANRQVRVLR
jgi:phosphohistidine swiveling domain-containing protein